MFFNEERGRPRLFNRQNFNRGKFNVSASQLAVSGAAALVLTGGVKGSLAFYMPPAAVNMKMDTRGRHSAILNAAAMAAVLRLGADGQSTGRVFADSPSAVIDLNMTGEMKCVVFAPNSDAGIHLDSIGHSLRRHFADSPWIMTALGLSGQSSRTMHGVLPIVEFELRLQGESMRRLSMAAPSARINLNAAGSAAMFGYSTITLPGLVIPIGGDLVIDTGEMTVTLNGEDVTRFFGADSEFFKLKPGENIVIYEDGVQNRDISYKILWKDLWL